MTATAAEALELALWLHGAPMRRAEVVARPLPEGIGYLLRVAAGGRDQVAAAATITGRSESDVLEAARFYAQQVLFHEGADAYRTLGLRPGDSHARAREHHRLLQQWLHPDRTGEGSWESVYAARINRAWGHLRTPQARDAYDAGLAAGGATGARAAVADRAAYGGSFAAPRPPPEASSSRHGRAVAVMAFVGCAALLAATTLRLEAPPAWLDPRPARAPSVPAREAMAVAAVDALIDERARADARDAALLEALGRDALSTAAIPPLHDAEAPWATPAPVVSADALLPEAVVPAMSTGPADGWPRDPRVAGAPSPGGAAGDVAVERLANLRAAELPPSPLLSAARLQSEDVLAFLADPAAPHPAVWNDLATLHAAASLRTSLHERVGRLQDAGFVIEDASWTEAADRIRLEARYRAGDERGRLDIGFRWRDGRSFVDALSLEPEA